jgi:hypothetical protein
LVLFLSFDFFGVFPTCKTSTKWGGVEEFLET